MKDDEHAGVWCSLGSMRLKKVLTEAAKKCESCNSRSSYINGWLIVAVRFIESDIDKAFVLGNISKIVAYCKSLKE